MKVAKHNNNLETNSQGESKSFGIGDASVVIEILRNRLYENKIQTLVQEYICNARDAMREVGKDNGFLVTVPTHIAPVFKVRDFGPGISPDRMEKVFILYGASTKRGTNNQTGGFGIGAKSAWSYTDSFTVVTIVDGTKRTYVCHTGTNNQGTLELTAETKTKEPNGTEIQIAVRRDDIYEFRNAVMRTIYFWESRPEVKNEDELPALTRGYMVSDNIETIHENGIPAFIGMDYNDTALAVIDGVPYPIGRKLIEKAKKLGEFVEKSLKQTAILHFGNGIVEVSASRESIADSQMSIDALNRMGVTGTDLVKKHVKSEFAKVKTTQEWVSTYRDLESYFDVGSEAKFGDYRIEHGRILSDNFKGIRMTRIHNLDKRGRYVVDRITKDELIKDNDKNISIELLDNIFVVTKDESAVIQNKRLRPWFDAMKTKPQQSKVILLEVLGDNKALLAQVVTDLGVKTFESLTYTEKPREERVKVVREKQEFCMHGFGSTRHLYTTLELAEQQGKTYLYVEMQDGSPKGFHADQLSNLNYYLRQDNMAVVGLAPRALAMIKDSENFKPLKEWLAEYKPCAGAINSVIREAAKNDNSIEGIIGVDNIKDDFLVQMAREYQIIRSGTRKTVEVPEMLKKVVLEHDKVKEFIAADKKLAELLSDKYPLVVEIGRYSRNRKELAFYINAKYNG